MKNSRFKFRVWAVDYDQYLPENQFVIDQDGELCHYAADMMKVPQTSFVIEQCTGLTDKNGKLIYEGDVVREHFEDGGSIDKVVFYNELQCKWYTRYDFQVSLGDAAFWEFGHHISHKLEIIGNIHEDQFREVTKKMEGNR